MKKLKDLFTLLSTIKDGSPLLIVSCLTQKSFPAFPVHGEPLHSFNGHIVFHEIYMFLIALLQKSSFSKIYLNSPANSIFIHTL